MLQKKNHSFSETVTIMDKVEHAKLSTSVYNANMTASCSVISEKLNCLLYEDFNYKGWALLCRSAV